MEIADEDPCQANPDDEEVGRLPGFTGPRSATEPPTLISYLADFGLTLGDLDPHQLAMFVAARNLAKEIEGLELPVASNETSVGDDSLAEHDTADELTAYQRDLADSELPADEMDVAPIRAVEDMARIFPTQWLLEEIWPEAFYAKLAERELLMPLWRQPTRGPQDDSDDSPDRELVEQQAKPDTVRQHAYVLLDTSRSMNDRDRRGIVARGLAIAFLHKGQESRSRLYLRPFTAAAGDLSSGRGVNDFHAIVRRIISLPHAGQTRIQAALEQAVRDIRSGGAFQRADILLITDGMSRLTQNPLADESLHTFLVGDLLEARESAGPVNTLKAWSRTFRRIWKGAFSEILVPTLEDCLTATESLQTLARDLPQDDSPCSAATFDRMLANIRSLLADMKRSLGKSAAVPDELQGMEKQLQETEQILAQVRAKQSGSAGSQSATSGRKPMSSSTGERGTGGFDLVRINPWDYLKRLVRWLRRVLARIRRNG